MSKYTKGIPNDKGFPNNFLENIENQLNGNGLKIHNPQFITYQNDLLSIDVLGGVDLQQIERMVCTLRITYKDYPPMRSTLDLYTDNQTDKLLRTICERWELTFIEVSNTIHGFIAELERYKLKRLKFPKGKEFSEFDMTEQELETARKYLSDINLIENLKSDFKELGILGEDENALVLFLAMASHRFNNPFSVLCLAKSDMGKSYLLQKLSSCMPKNAYSFHTQISENALYYFDSQQIDGKVLFVEDLDFTHQMLTPLSTLQTNGKLTKTRTTKNKDGVLYATTLEVSAKLCFIASAYSEKNYEKLSLPFLFLHLNQSLTQDIELMNYEKKCKAGLVDQGNILNIERRLQCVIASLENISVVNSFAPMIELPEGLPNPRKTLMLLLNFMDVITFFFQHQREKIVNKQTGEIYIKTAPEDVELAFSLLKNSLLLKVDELSVSTRGFYNWLTNFSKETNLNQFTALDIRKAKQIHPRTLNRYLHELTLFNYVQITGGNKHRGGFIYKATNLENIQDLQLDVETSFKNTIKQIHGEKPSAINSKEITETPRVAIDNEATFFAKNYKRIRINEKEEHTYKIILKLEEKEPNREYLTSDITGISKRSQCIEARYLKTLWEQGKLNRVWKKRQYYYSLTTSSKSVSQNPLSNS